MKKTILTLVLLTGLSSVLFAQSTYNRAKLSIGAELALPVGDLGLISSLGYGASLKGELNVAESLNLTASAGFLSFGYKKEFKDLFKAAGISMGSMSAIPLKAGAKYNFGQKFYAAAELGASFGLTEGGGTAFVYAPGAGIVLPLSSGKSVDIGVRYESWANQGNASFIGFRAAYTFGI